MEAGTQTRPDRPLAGRLRPGGARVLARARRVNLPLLLIFAGGTLLSAVFTLRVSEWGLMTDELQHVKLAASIADTLNPLPRIRGEAINAYSQLYPLLIAPVVGLFDMPTAFRLIHGINSVLMASTAIPAYLLARDVVGSRRAALLVAALTVTVPWIAMGALVMTETAAYPAFVWAAYAIYRAIVDRSPRADLLALLAIAVAILARTQFVALAPAFPLAVLLHELGFAARGERDAPLGARLRAALARSAGGHVVLVGATVLGVVVVGALTAAGRLDLVLGNYVATTGGDLVPPGTGKMAAQLAAATGVAIGILPLAAGGAWAISTLVRPGDRRRHAFSALLVVVTVLLVAEVSSFLVRFSGSPQDRYVFYLAPLFVLALVACVLEARARWVAVALGGAVFAWITTTVDFSVASAPAYFGSPPSQFRVVIEGRVQQLSDILGGGVLTVGRLMIAASLLGAAALALALRSGRVPRPGLLLVVGAVLLVFQVGETAYSANRIVSYISGQPVGGRDWVDRRLPAGSHAAIVPGVVNSAANGTPVFLDDWVNSVNWWWIEFWNKSIKLAYSYEGAQFAGITPFDTRPLTVDNATGAVEAQVETPYLVVSSSDPRQRLRASSVELNPGGLELVKAGLPLRADWVTEGLPENGWTPKGEPVRLRLFGGPEVEGRERKLTIQLDSIPAITQERRVVLRSGRRKVQASVAANTYRTVELEVCMRRAPYTDVSVRVFDGPPAPGSPPGLHVSKIDAGPPGAPCRA